MPGKGQRLSLLRAIHHSCGGIAPLDDRGVTFAVAQFEQLIHDPTSRTMPVMNVDRTQLLN